MLIPAPEKKKIALTREKQQKIPKSTKTPPKKHKNTKKDELNTRHFFALTREIKPLTDPELKHWPFL